MKRFLILCILFSPCGVAFCASPLTTTFNPFTGKFDFVNNLSSSSAGLLLDISTAGATAGNTYCWSFDGTKFSPVTCPGGTGGSTIWVKKDDSAFDNSVSTLNFNSPGLSIVDGPSGQVNLGLNPATTFWVLVNPISSPQAGGFNIASGTVNSFYYVNGQMVVSSDTSQNVPLLLVKQTHSTSQYPMMFSIRNVTPVAVGNLATMSFDSFYSLGMDQVAVLESAVTDTNSVSSAAGNLNFYIKSGAGLRRAMSLQGSTINGASPNVFIDKSLVVSSTFNVVSTGTLSGNRIVCIDAPSDTNVLAWSASRSCWAPATASSGGGGASALFVFKDGSAFDNSVSTLNFNSPGLLISDGPSGQVNISLDPGATFYLTASSATTNYLQNSSATVTYLQISSAVLTYLQNSSATLVYLQKSSATSTYLTLSSAAGNYLPYTALIAGTNVTLTPSGTTLTIASSGSGGTDNYPSTSTIIATAGGITASTGVFSSSVTLGSVAQGGSVIYASTTYNIQASTSLTVLGVIVATSVPSNAGMSYFNRGLTINNSTQTTSDSSLIVTGSVGGTGKTLFLADVVNNVVVASSNFQVNGHIEVSSTTPTMGSCGTSPSVTGNDVAGKITVGGGVVTSCAMNFAGIWTRAPACSLVSDTAVTSMTGSTTSTTLTVGGAATFNGAVVMYTCFGSKNP